MSWVTLSMETVNFYELGFELNLVLISVLIVCSKTDTCFSFKNYEVEVLVCLTCTS